MLVGLNCLFARLLLVCCLLMFVHCLDIGDFVWFACLILLVLGYFKFNLCCWVLILFVLWFELNLRRVFGVLNLLAVFYFACVWF